MQDSTRICENTSLLSHDIVFVLRNSQTLNRSGSAVSGSTQINICERHEFKPSAWKKEFKMHQFSCCFSKTNYRHQTCKKKGGLDNLSVPGFGTVTRCHKKGTVKSAEHGVYVLRLFALPRRSWMCLQNVKTKLSLPQTYLYKCYGQQTLNASTMTTLSLHQTSWTNLSELQRELG